MAESEKWQKFYDTAFNYYRNDLTLLFNRFNYFLIATAFLVAAFVTLIINMKPTTIEYLSFFAIMVASIGFLISCGFIVINLLNAKIIFNIGESLLSKINKNSYFG